MVLVTKCKSVIHCVNASPSRTSTVDDATMEFHPDKYWKGGEEKSFRVLLSPSRLVRFVVLDIEPCAQYKGTVTSVADDMHSEKKGADLYCFADVEVVRESDFGVNDISYRCVTHLGNILRVGDVVLGYDLQASVLPSDLMENFSQFFNSSFELPDVVIVRKSNDGFHSTNNEEHHGVQNRSKSSASKKRDRRRQKTERKIESLEKTATRMGFLQIGNGHKSLSDADEISLIENIAAFEEEMKNPGLMGISCEKTGTIAVQLEDDDGNKMLPR